MRANQLLVSVVINCLLKALVSESLDEENLRQLILDFSQAPLSFASPVSQKQREQFVNKVITTCQKINQLQETRRQAKVSKYLDINLKN